MIYFVNSLTYLRFFLAIIIFLSIALLENFILALILFFIAGLSDYFDGYLARKYDAETEVGEILDPVADKILIVFLFFALALELNSLLVSLCGSLIISREIWVSALRDYNARRNNTRATKVTFIAKAKTSIQLFTIFIYLLGLSSKIMLLIVIGDILLITSLLVTLYTGYEYTLNSYKN